MRMRTGRGHRVRMGRSGDRCLLLKSRDRTTNYGRTSWVGDFYVHVVDALMNAGIWPVGVRYTILGSNWDRDESTSDDAPPRRVTAGDTHGGGGDCT